MRLFNVDSRLSCLQRAVEVREFLSSPLSLPQIMVMELLTVHINAISKLCGGELRDPWSLMVSGATSRRRWKHSDFKVAVVSKLYQSRQLSVSSLPFKPQSSTRMYKWLCLFWCSPMNSLTSLGYCCYAGKQYLNSINGFSHLKLLEI